MRKYLATLITASTIFSCVQVANAEVAPNTGVEINVGLDQATGMKVRTNFGTSRVEGIPALKQLRREMWDINSPIEGRPLREVAAMYGYYDRSAYVNSIEADAALTAIAVQRAAEETVLPNGHDRPGPDSNIWSATWQTRFAALARILESLTTMRESRG